MLFSSPPEKGEKTRCGEDVLYRVIHKRVSQREGIQGKQSVHSLTFDLKIGLGEKKGYSSSKMVRATRVDWGPDFVRGCGAFLGKLSSGPCRFLNISSNDCWRGKRYLSAPGRALANVSP